MTEDVAAVIIVRVTGNEWAGEGGGREKGSCNKSRCKTHFEVIDELWKTITKECV
jgi:hypothetical protein